MLITELRKNRDAMEAMRQFFNNPSFRLIQSAFVCHSPSGDEKVENSTSVAHGQYLGTRYVFNKIEELVKAGPENPNPPPKKSGGKDPDLE